MWNNIRLKRKMKKYNTCYNQAKEICSIVNFLNEPKYKIHTHTIFLLWDDDEKKKHFSRENVTRRIRKAFPFLNRSHFCVWLSVLFMLDELLFTFLPRFFHSTINVVHMIKAKRNGYFALSKISLAFAFRKFICDQYTHSKWLLV